jgi:hypothetical protein
VAIGGPGSYVCGMDPSRGDPDEDLLAAAQEAFRETEQLIAQAGELTAKRDADLVDFEVQLGRALRKGGRDEGACELRSLLQKHAAQGGRAAVGALERLAEEDPWWSEGR